MRITNYPAHHLKRIPPPSKSRLFNRKRFFPLFFYSLARTGLKAGYRSIPLMSPLSLLPFQANWISSGAMLYFGWLTGNIIKRDLPCVIILLTAQRFRGWEEDRTVPNFSCSRYTCQIVSGQTFFKVNFIFKYTRALHKTGKTLDKYSRLCVDSPCIIQSYRV